MYDVIRSGSTARRRFVPRNDPPPSACAPASSTRQTRSWSAIRVRLSLDDIARRVASSRRQLQRAYAEIGRTTFRDHLTRVRMERAAEMLAARMLTVREVAHRVGYRQPAQFAKAFRRYRGIAPSDFRAGGGSRERRSSGEADRVAEPERDRSARVRRSSHVGCRVHGRGEPMSDRATGRLAGGRAQVRRCS